MKKRKIENKNFQIVNYFRPVSQENTNEELATSTKATQEEPVSTETPPNTSAVQTETSTENPQSIQTGVQRPSDITVQATPASTPQTDTNPFSTDECMDIINKLFDSNKTVHNKFICSKNCCSDISDGEKKRMIPKKFNHKFVGQTWWLCYVEGEGMFCILCRKHKMVHNVNKRDVFVNTGGQRFLPDAIKGHSSSSIHKDAYETEMTQRMSFFQLEINKKADVASSVYEKVFHTAYFLMKSFIANRKFLPTLDFIEKVFESHDLKFFDHRSRGSQREIFLTTGEAIKEHMLKSVRSGSVFGLLVDEVADVSVTENLITFIQYFDTESRHVKTSFLSCQSVLQNFDAANAATITALIKQTLQASNLPLAHLTGFTSDGAAVMLGAKNGVAEQLRKECPTLISVHCVCHKLALSCTDTNESIKFIKDVETWLRQLWKYFEDSPKRLALYIKTQLAMKELNLSRGGAKNVATRLKKACRTRWLSLEASVKAVYNDYEAILHTLDQLQSTDATAKGLLCKMKTSKFLGTLYILMDVLPVLGELSRCFQRDSLNFSMIAPQVEATLARLDDIMENETPLVKLSSDLDSISKISEDITFPPRQMDELSNIFTRYIPALKQNIRRRFEESSEVVSAFGVFNPLSIPDSKMPGFKDHGVADIDVLGNHFFNGQVDQLQTEWMGMKYHILNLLVPNMPVEVRQGSTKQSPTEWLLLRILNESTYKKFFPAISHLAEVAATLPVTNAWPERGASALKNLRTRLRNRLSPDMLDSLLHVCINGPEVENADDIVKEAVDIWLKTKPRRKLAKKSNESQLKASSSVQVQTDEVTIVDQETLRSEIASAVKAFRLENDPASESDSDFDEYDMICK